MPEKPTQLIERESVAQKYETMHINAPYRAAEFDDETLEAIIDGKGFLFISNTEVNGEGDKKRQVYNKQLLEYVIGGALNYSISFDESTSMITASVCDSDKSTNIVYEGRLYPEAIAAIEAAGF